MRAKPQAEASIIIFIAFTPRVDFNVSGNCDNIIFIVSYLNNIPIHKTQILYHEERRFINN